MPSPNMLCRFSIRNAPGNAHARQINTPVMTIQVSSSLQFILQGPLQFALTAGFSGIGGHEGRAFAPGQQFLQFVDNVRVNDVLDLVGVVMNVLRRDVRVVQQIGFPKPVIARDAPGLDFSRRGEMCRGAGIVPDQQAFREAQRGADAAGAIRSSDSPPQFREGHRVVKQAGRIAGRWLPLSHHS